MQRITRSVLVVVGLVVGARNLYSGPGVSVGYSNISIGEPSTVYGLRYQLGARLRVVDRVSLFAETGVSYRTSGPSGDESASIGTTNLGIIVFLK